MNEKLQLNKDDISIALVGKDKPFTILNNDQIEEILEKKNFDVNLM